jgi:hypothetical protein
LVSFSISCILFWSLSSFWFLSRFFQQAFISSLKIEFWFINHDWLLLLYLFYAFHIWMLAHHSYKFQKWKSLSKLLVYFV